MYTKILTFCLFRPNCENMNINKWKETGKYFDFEGHKIFYRSEISDKPLLLCLHGFPTSSHDYHKIWDSLEKKFSLLAFDMIGYGFSAKPPNYNYTTFKQADVLQSLVNKLEIKELHVLSQDYGNTIMQEVFARKEEGKLDFEIKSICMMNGALFPETHTPILAQKILISPIGFLFNVFVTENRMKQALASVFGKETQPSKKELDEFLELLRFNNGHKIAYKLIQYMKERNKYRTRWVGALECYNRPFRMINGLDDPVSGIHLVKRFREIMPHKDIIELTNIGHFPHLESPETTVKHFFEFHENFR